MLLHHLRSAVFCGAAVHAATSAAAKVAHFAAALSSAFEPVVTEAPNLELERRQNGAMTVYYAPDNTCGFVSGLSGMCLLLRFALACV